MDMMSLRRRVMVNQNKLMTATGNPITFNTPLTKPLKCVVRFTPQQEGSGTPSPENVREIVGKNSVSVWVSGKNLCPEISDEEYWSIRGYFIGSGEITLNSRYRMCDYRPIKPDTDYTFSTSGTGWKGIGFYDVNYEPVGYKQANAVSVSLKSPSNARYYRIYSVYNANVNNIQFEIGSTATAYEPFTASVETSVSFPSTTKNLLDSTKRKDGYYIDATGKEIANAQFGYTTAYTPVEPNETYVLSGNIGNHGSAYGAVYCYDENKNFVNRLSGFKTNKVPHTFTVPSDTYYINIQYFKSQAVLTDAQIEKGSTATEYEAFDNTIYGGYVDLVNGEVVAEWAKVDMGDLNWGISWNTFATAPSNSANNGTSNTPTNIMCDIYPSDINAPATEVGRIDKNIRGRANYKNICIRDDDYTTAADFKTAVMGHYLAYKLAEPIHYPLSPRILTTLQGNNVMWSDANGDITVRYWTR